MIMKKLLITTIAFLSLILLLSTGSEVSENKYQNYAESEPITGGDIPFVNINLEAKSAVVFDLANNEAIFELNSSSQLPLASLTKVMTAIVVEENFPEWMKMGIALEAIKQEGDSGFIAGEKWKVGDLSDAMLISSSNDAAFAFASAFGSVSGKPNGGASVSELVETMNRRARELNLSQTFFLNPTGLDMNESVAGAYGSANNIASLIAYALKEYPSLLVITRDGFFDINSRRYKNTNKIVNKVPRIIAGKTGYSDLAGGNLAIVADVGLGHPVAIVVLGSSKQGRFDDVGKLYQETLRWFQNK